MTVTAIDPGQRVATLSLSDLDRLRAHRICGSEPLQDNGFDGVHVRLSEAYALLSVIESACSEGSTFHALNGEIQSRAICAIQRPIAEADFEAVRLHDAAQGGGHV